MKSELNTEKIHKVYGIIMNQGERTKRGKIYEGIEAFASSDDYRIFMRSRGVQLKVGFHNIYHIDYQEEELRDQFLAHIVRLAQLNSEA